MIEATIEEQNLRAILQALDVVPRALRSGMFQAAETMQNLAIQRTPRYDDKLRTGKAKGKPHAVTLWGQVQMHAGGFSFMNPASYMGILEDGLYPGVNEKRSPRRTMYYEDGIYSTQAPGGILKWLLSQENVLEQLAAEIERELVRGLTNVGT